jgi:hypothetical protein
VSRRLAAVSFAGLREAEQPVPAVTAE